MGSRATLDQVASPGHDFFARARIRLTLEVPAGLSDAGVLPLRGDHDLDPVME